MRKQLLAATIMAASMAVASFPAEARRSAAAQPVHECLTDEGRAGRVGCIAAPRASHAPARGHRKAAKAKPQKRHNVSRETSRGDDAGLVRSKKTGATARVASKYRDKFQAYVDAVEAEGAAIHYMGGWRRGRCSIPRNKHPCGMALDVCQDARGRVSRAKDCRLPPPARLAQIASRFGLVEGGVWCNSDYGHAEVRTARQAKGCGKSNLYAAVARWKAGG